MKKITRAMELIAASRIIKAQQRAQSGRAVRPRADPGGLGGGDVLQRRPPADHRAGGPQAGRDADRDQRPRSGRRLLLERAQGGRAARRAAARGGQGDRAPTSAGRKGEAYFRFRSRPVVESWTGFSDQPLVRRRPRDRQGADRRLPRRGAASTRVDEVHVVYTRFRSMLVQEPHRVRLLPLEVVEGEEKPAPDEVLPLYEFEPSPRGARRAAPAVRPEPDLLRAAAGARPPSSPRGRRR